MSALPPARNISPRQAAHYLKRGAVLIDIREDYEHNAERIAGDRLVALSALPARLDTAGRAAVFYCQHGNRTDHEATRLAGLVDTRAYLLQGGIEAWKRAGLPVIGDDKAAAGALLLRRLLKAIDQSKD